MVEYSGNFNDKNFSRLGNLQYKLLIYKQNAIIW